MKVFISYSHAQKDWVHDKLVPVLEASEVKVLIDARRFEAGKHLRKQMDALQDEADKSLHVFSPEFLKSENCMHELQRSLDRDPGFEAGYLIPVIREKCQLPDPIPEALYIDLCDDTNDDQWDRLFRACGTDLFSPATKWLNARKQIVRGMQRFDCVNLVAEKGTRWRQLLDLIKKVDLPELLEIDFKSGETVTRRSLIETILRECGHAEIAVPEKEDLVVFERVLKDRDRPLLLGFIHFEFAARERMQRYGMDLLSSIRFMIGQRKIILLVHSSVPFLELLPQEHPLSSLTSIQKIHLPLKK